MQAGDAQPHPAQPVQQTPTPQNIAPQGGIANQPHLAAAPSVAAKPNELNLLSTVMPVPMRRYALPVVIAVVVIAGVWIWLAQ